MSKSNQVRSAVAIVTMCASVAGVITTAVLSAKATPKAKQLLDELKKEKPEPTKKEIVKTVAPAYLPAAISGAVTIACIVGTTILNRKNQASLASAYAVLNHNYQRYRTTVKKIFGEDADQKVMDEIIKSECDAPYISAVNGFGCSSLDWDVDEETYLFFDSYSERYFESTIGKVLQAEYHLNRNFSIGGGASINEFYEFLGLDPIVNGDKVGWDFEGGIVWIDFCHRTVRLEEDGNLDCLVIDYEFTPWEANEDYMSRR